MIIYIDTTKDHNIELIIKDGNAIIDQTKFEARYKQAELLLPAIDKLLAENKIKLDDIKEIRVENKGGSFTSLRIGVVTANALGYALGIPVHDLTGKKAGRNMEFDVVEPFYSNSKQ